MRIKGTHKKISGEMGTLPFTSKTLERFRRQKLPGSLVISLTFHLIVAVIAGLYYPGNTQHQYTNRNLVTADIINPLAPPEPMVRKPVIKGTLHSSTVVENRHVQRRSIKAKYAGAAASFDVANPQAQGLNPLTMPPILMSIFSITAPIRLSIQKMTPFRHSLWTWILRPMLWRDATSEMDTYPRKMQCALRNL